MNDNRADLDSRIQHLLDVVERNRAARCAAIIEEAETQARQIVRQAYGEARRHLHRKVLSIREESAQKLGRADAKRQTRARLQRHNADRALIARAWEPLNVQLLARWRRADTRAQWIDLIIKQAGEALLEAPWCVEHPADLPDAERRAITERILALSGTPPELRVETGISAGVRICAGPACVDGTRRGLLRARARIEGLMLATLNDCRKRYSGAPRA